MSDAPSESNWLYGIHDPGGEHLMLRAGRPGWVVISQNVGHDPDNEEGQDFRRYRVHRLGVICRLNNSLSPDGTIPISSRYGDFAERCANCVDSSRGCSIWIIGNEPNAASERPAFRNPFGDSRFPFRIGRRAVHKVRRVLHSWTQSKAAQVPESPATETITPQLYAECYGKCRNAIHQVPGHEADQVLVAAIAPWNSDTRYAGNEWGDWVVYFQDVLSLLGSDGCDGFVLHTSTHESDPRLISSSATMNAPYEGRHMEFRAYRDFLEAAPNSMRHLPVYVTQTHQGVPWHEANTGWVQTAYDEIDGWNRMPGTQTIRALALYRWMESDPRSMRRKNGIWDDFRVAMQGNHHWRNLGLPPWGKGDRLLTLTYVEMHETPAANGAPRPEGPRLPDAGACDVLAPYTELIVERGPEGSPTVRANAPRGRPTWWYVREAQPEFSAREGWVVQDTWAGERQLYLLPKDRNLGASAAGQPPELRPGGRARTLDIVRMRLRPGFQDKPDADVVADVPADAALAVLAGPKSAEGLRWWLMRWQVSSVEEYTGWMAEFTPAGQVLLAASDGDDGKNPDRLQRFAPGDLAETLTLVRLRKSPGYMDKPDSDVIADIWQGTPVEIQRGPVREDDLEWWRVRTVDAEDSAVRGWMAERSPEGAPLLGKRVAEPAPHFEVGDLAAVRYIPVRIRNSPGYLAKDDADVLGEFGPKTTVVIQDGEEPVDGLVWWRAGGISRFGEVIGWVAQNTPGGVPLVGMVEPLPRTDIPNAVMGAYLGAPYTAQYGIGQLWGENGSFYRRYAYDGVELLGHNGIDFLLPAGGVVFATEAGTVAMTGFEPAGFGRYILLSHAWGESIYAHLGKATVELGQRIRRGDPIGISGSSGGSTGPHLHFSIRIFPYYRGDGWGGFSDPLPYLNPNAYLLPNYILDEQYQIHRAGRRPIFARLAPSAMTEDCPGLERP